MADNECRRKFDNKFVFKKSKAESHNKEIAEERQIFCSSFRIQQIQENHSTLYVWNYSIHLLFQELEILLVRSFCPMQSLHEFEL